MNWFKRIFGKSEDEGNFQMGPLVALGASDEPPPSISVSATGFDVMPEGARLTLLAPGWVVSGAFTMWEVAEFIRRETANYPNETLFAVLEDVDQALYTSSHSSNANELGDIEPENETGIHPGSFRKFREDDPIDFWGLTHPSEFPIQHRIFMDFVKGHSASCWHGGMAWQSAPDNLPVLLNGSDVRPYLSGHRWGVDRRTYVLRVPVATACEAIAAFPNGYFFDDMGPEENYYLAKALEDKFGLRIIGLGATYAGYMRDEPFTAEEARTLGAFLSPLYSNEPQDVAEKISAMATGEDTLFLAYANR